TRSMRNQRCPSRLGPWDCRLTSRREEIVDCVKGTDRSRLIGERPGFLVKGVHGSQRMHAGKVCDSQNGLLKDKLASGLKRLLSPERDQEHAPSRKRTSYCGMPRSPGPLLRSPSPRSQTLQQSEREQETISTSSPPCSGSSPVRLNSLSTRSRPISAQAAPPSFISLGLSFTHPTPSLRRSDSFAFITRSSSSSSLNFSNSSSSPASLVAPLQGCAQQRIRNPL
ncbi:hypothetical protein C8R45DRAFT_1032975, partial [Mycena sanguinolenta]